MSEISNHDEVIDSRDVIGEIEALRSNLAEFGPDDEMAETWQEALKALESLADQASDYASDWEYGETLIRDSYFTEYARAGRRPRIHEREHCRTMAVHLY